MDTGDTRSVDVLEVISDHNTYKILKLVSMKQDGYTIEQLSKALELTKKQLYFRIKKLGKTGLVKRQNGKISTTILGNSVINAMRPVHDALRIHIQLKAIDTFALSGGNSRREINLLIDTMIEDGAIRKMIKEVPRRYASGNNYLNQLFLECQTHSWLIIFAMEIPIASTNIPIRIVLFSLLLWRTTLFVSI